MATRASKVPPRATIARFRIDTDLLEKALLAAKATTGGNFSEFVREAIDEKVADVLGRSAA